MVNIRYSYQRKAEKIKCTGVKVVPVLSLGCVHFSRILGHIYPDIKKSNGNVERLLDVFRSVDSGSEYV